MNNEYLIIKFITYGKCQFTNSTGHDVSLKFFVILTDVNIDKQISSFISVITVVIK